MNSEGEPGPILLPYAELKKDYKFTWYLQSANFISNITSLSADSAWNSVQYGILFNPVYTAYISQLAETINLPDDELEMDHIDLGVVTYPVPKRFKLNDISVVYYDDTFNSVYNFHKTWMNLARKGEGLCMNPMKQFACSAYHVTTENTLTGSQYEAIFAKIKQMSTSMASIVDATTMPVQAAASSSIVDPTQTINSISSKTKALMLDAIASKPTGVTRYPYIFPTRINRTPSSRSGTGLSKVTVTYCRIPDLNKPKPYVKLNSTNV